jgi:hypothetical protein
MTIAQQLACKSQIQIDEDCPVTGSDWEGERELIFLLDEPVRLSPFVKGLGKDFSDALTYAVAASPAELAHHTRRIFHSYEHHDREGLYAALFDLFSVLAGAGRDLKKRLLNGVADRLAPECREQFALWLTEGRAPQSSDLAAICGSVFAQGIEGCRDLVRVSTVSAGRIRDPLIEAREHIEYSQLDQARALLEAAVLQEPHREELQLELIALYRATRDAHGHSSMSRRLERLVDVLPDFWRVGGATLEEAGTR